MTVHPQEYDTDKGGGQLDYVISAKRRHYYEYALDVQADLIDRTDAARRGVPYIGIALYVANRH